MTKLILTSSTLLYWLLLLLLFLIFLIQTLLRWRLLMLPQFYPKQRGTNGSTDTGTLSLGLFSPSASNIITVNICHWYHGENRQDSLSKETNASSEVRLSYSWCGGNCLGIFFFFLGALNTWHHLCCALKFLQSESSMFYDAERLPHTFS